MYVRMSDNLQNEIIGQIRKVYGEVNYLQKKIKYRSLLIKRTYVS